MVRTAFKVTMRWSEDKEKRSNQLMTYSRRHMLESSVLYLPYITHMKRYGFPTYPELHLVLHFNYLCPQQTCFLVNLGILNRIVANPSIVVSVPCSPTSFLNLPTYFGQKKRGGGLFSQHKCTYMAVHAYPLNPSSTLRACRSSVEYELSVLFSSSPSHSCTQLR